MTYRPAENSFHRGIVCLNSGERVAALAYFEAAVRLDKQRYPMHPTMRYLSYFGLCLAFATDSLQEAQRCCEEAAQAEFYNPDMHWNLGRVALLNGDRQAAFAAFCCGLKIDGNHAGLRFQIRRLGVRKRRVLSALGRSHPLNRIAGRVRSNLSE